MTTALNIDHQPAKVLRFPDPDPFARQAMAAVADTYGLPVTSIPMRGRSLHVARARQVWMWVLREAGYSFPAVGKATGRDHQTVQHGCRAVKQRMVRDAHTAARNVSLLETLGIRQAIPCEGFVGYVIGLREGDYGNGKPGDICKRPGCGLNRQRHGR